MCSRCAPANVAHCMPDALYRLVRTIGSSSATVAKWGFTPSGISLAGFVCAPGTVQYMTRVSSAWHCYVRTPLMSLKGGHVTSFELRVIRAERLPNATPFLESRARVLIARRSHLHLRWSTLHKLTVFPTLLSWYIPPPTSTINSNGPHIYPQPPHPSRRPPECPHPLTVG